MIHHRLGFMLFDSLIALGVCSTLMIVIATTLHSEQSASRQLTDIRAATRLAEESLGRLQQGLPLEKPESSDELTVDNVEQGRAIPGFKWIRVNATRNGRTVHLIGLAPVTAEGK
jgi:hypothetical protein